METEKLKNPIEEYIQNNLNEGSTFKDLFEANPENVDLRTDLDAGELVTAAKINSNDSYLKQKLGFSVYGEFLEKYFRLKISYDRKSRIEFVDVNRKNQFEQDLKRFGDFSNVMEIRK